MTNQFYWRKDPFANSTSWPNQFLFKAVVLPAPTSQDVQRSDFYNCGQRSLDDPTWEMTWGFLCRRCRTVWGQAGIWSTSAWDCLTSIWIKLIQVCWTWPFCVACPAAPMLWRLLGFKFYNDLLAVPVSRIRKWHIDTLPLVVELTVPCRALIWFIMPCASQMSREGKTSPAWRQPQRRRMLRLAKSWRLLKRTMELDVPQWRPGPSCPKATGLPQVFFLLQQQSWRGTALMAHEADEGSGGLQLYFRGRGVINFFHDWSQTVLKSGEPSSTKPPPGRLRGQGCLSALLGWSLWLWGFLHVKDLIAHDSNSRDLIRLDSTWFNSGFLWWTVFLGGTLFDP